jgi:hypothetical protein
MPRPTSFQQDLFCIFLLAVLSLTLWLPVLDAVSLNPDESQYEATASYLVATGTPAFLPNGAPGMFGLFKLATWLAGPYPIFVMRGLVMAIAFGIATMLFRIVYRETNRWCGLLSGLVFLHGVVPFEGFTVNREWFASLVTVGGLSVYATIRRHERPRTWFLLASGFLCGMALWFKLQASFITLVVPVVLLVEAAVSRSASRLRDELPWFAAGGLAAGVAYLVPFSMNGTLGQFLEFMFTDVQVYVGGNDAVVKPSYLDRFFLDLPHRGLFLIAYALTAVVIVVWIARLFRPGDTSRRPGSAVSMFAAYLVFAMICVQLGSRFYSHYYQLMLPAVAGLVGLAVHAVMRPTQARPARVTGLVVALLIVLQTVFVAGYEQLAPRPASMSHNGYKYVELTEYFKREAGAGDRLFVWGWAPEIYSLSRLEAASHITFCQYVVNDIPGFPDRPSINEEWARMLMDELEATKPRFIVDASRATWFETEAWIYDLRNYPEFELNTLLDTEYREIARVDDCTIWEREGGAQQ